MTRRDSCEPMPPSMWRVDPKPWCPECCVRAEHCGCPTGERIDAEAHIIRGEE